MANGQAMLDWQKSKQAQSAPSNQAQLTWENSYRGREALAAGFTYADDLERIAILRGEKVASSPEPKIRAAIPPATSISTIQQRVVAQTVVPSTPKPKPKQVATPGEETLYQFCQNEGLTKAEALAEVNAMRRDQGKEPLVPQS